ncbi:IS3 family transposase [Saccharothrix sp. ALI-22-I]|uniref:IS3 family transposase n=1 Tax=Saccharothrix sp. ALI-22-I TaxID=1933778 RepID=UPI003FD1737B
MRRARIFGEIAVSTSSSCFTVRPEKNERQRRNVSRCHRELLWHPGPSARRRQDADLAEQIVAIHDESRGTYGAPRVHAELRTRGHRHSCKRVARLLRQAGRACRAPKRWRTTTVPDPAATTAPDLIRRDFSCAATEVDTRWAVTSPISTPGRGGSTWPP